MLHISNMDNECRVFIGCIQMSVFHHSYRLVARLSLTSPQRPSGGLSVDFQWVRLGADGLLAGLHWFNYPKFIAIWKWRCKMFIKVLNNYFIKTILELSWLEIISWYRKHDTEIFTSMGCRSNHMHFINVVYGCPSVAHISLVVTCHHGPDLLTVNMSQYIQLKSTRVQSASPEPGDLDAATERVFSSPLQSSQSTLLQAWPPGLVWCHFLWGCFCPAAVGCLQTWSQSHQRSLRRRKE